MSGISGDIDVLPLANDCSSVLTISMKGRKYKERKDDKRKRLLADMPDIYL